MPAKKVQVEVIQGNSFRTECRAGRHTVLIDQPVAAGGTDTGATPLDFQLFALGGCLAAIGRIMANQRHLPLRAIRVKVEGEIDTDGLLGKASPDRVGFSAISAKVELDGDLTPDQKQALLHEIDQRCPISDNLKNSTGLAVVPAP